MLTALLITILPTLLAYIVLSKIGLKPKSIFLKLALSWFAGMYIFTIVTFLLATLFTLVTSGVLVKATYATLLLTQIALLFFVKDVRGILVSIKRSGKSHAVFNPLNVFLILFCLLFPVIFFAHHLTMVNNQLLTTYIYWDFQWQMSLIQSFIYGDNFPPQNEAFAGLSHTYHYFWMVYAAIYGAAGLNLVGAINVATILGFFFVLIALIGLSEEFFHSRLAGFIAVLLAITSSSLRFIDFFGQHQGKSLSELLTLIFATTQHPWYFSFLTVGDVVYSGIMFNLFYVLEERQMITGIIFLLLSIWLIYQRKLLSNTVLFFLGALMGGFFLWHFQVTLMVFVALFFLLLVDNDKKKLLYLFAGYGVVFAACYFYFTHLINSVWFTGNIGNFPAFNTGFTSQEGKEFSLLKAFQYYIYSYGLKLFLVPIGLIYLWRKNKRLAVILTSIIIPTFIIVNTVQLNPPTVYENHKLFRPMNFVVDLVAALIVYRLFFFKKVFSLKVIGVLCIFFLTISGVLEHMTFINVKPTQVIAQYDSSLVLSIRKHTQPKAVFVSSKNTAVYFAGRKLFLARQLRGHDDLVLDKKRRSGIIESIYYADSVQSFCKLTKPYGIDYVEFGNDTISPLKERVRSLPHFETIDENKEPLIFVDAEKTCL